jgi:deoxyribonuclease-1
MRIAALLFLICSCTGLVPTKASRAEGPHPPAEILQGNSQLWKFTTAVKKIAEISDHNPVTIYCPCKYKWKTVDLSSCGFIPSHHTKRSDRIEWEHVAAAESFGQSFKLWRDGDPVLCVDRKKGPYKGRKCAEKDPEYLRMETDLYNLWPIIGELNALRSNYSMAQLSGSDYDFGGCKAKIQDRKFEPMDEYKGIVARIHMYMDLVYPHHGVISDKNKKLFAAWDKKYPVTAWECERAGMIREVQGNTNPILHQSCASR